MLEAAAVDRDGYLKVVYENMDVLWKNRCSTKMKNAKFRHFVLKKKTLDRFVDKIAKSLAGRGDNYRVAFGASNFSAMGNKHKHHTSPYSLLGKMIESKVGKERFALVDEWNTSKVCHRCREPLQIIAAYREEKGEGEMNRTVLRQIRGLSRCRSAKSSPDKDGCYPISGAFVDRDYNVACNIAQMYVRAVSTVEATPCKLDRGVHVERGKENKDYFVLRSNNWSYFKEKQTNRAVVQHRRHDSGLLAFLS